MLSYRCCLIRSHRAHHNTYIAEIMAAILPCVARHRDRKVLPCHQQHSNQFLMAFDHEIAAPIVFMFSVLDQLLRRQSIQITSL